MHSLLTLLQHGLVLDGLQFCCRMCGNPQCIFTTAGEEFIIVCTLQNSVVKIPRQQTTNVKILVTCFQLFLCLQFQLAWLSIQCTNICNIWTHQSPCFNYTLPVSDLVKHSLWSIYHVVSPYCKERANIYISWLY